LVAFDLLRDFYDPALGQPLLQLLAVVVGGGFLDLRLDLVDARLDVGLLAGAVDDRRIFFVNHHSLSAAEHVDGDILELDAEVFTNRLAAGRQRRCSTGKAARATQSADLTSACSATLATPEEIENGVFADNVETYRKLTGQAA
jgi:hypothetical protein